MLKIPFDRSCPANDIQRLKPGPINGRVAIGGGFGL